MKWPKLTLTRKTVMAILGGLVTVIAAWAIFSFTKAARVDADLLLQESIQKTLASTSYRFSIETKMGDDQKPISSIEGERAAGENVHIKGTLINSPVEFVQHQDSTYMKDPITEKWLTLQGNQLAQAESFVIEFNPLVNFNFKDVPTVKYLGQEKIANKPLALLEFAPNVEIPFLEAQFDSFNYQLWIDSSDKRIYRAKILASNATNDKMQLHILINLWDFDQQITITPPV